MSPDVGFDPEHEAAVVRAYVSTYCRNLLGDRVADSTQARVLDAVLRLEQAAQEREAA